MVVDYKGRGRTSGVELERIGAKAANLLRFKNGKVIQVVIYLDHKRAFADLGLAREGDSP